MSEEFDEATDENVYVYSAELVTGDRFEGHVYAKSLVEAKKKLEAEKLSDVKFYTDDSFYTRTENPHAIPFEKRDPSHTIKIQTMSLPRGALILTLKQHATDVFIIFILLAALAFVGGWIQLIAFALMGYTVWYYYRFITRTTIPSFLYNRILRALVNGEPDEALSTIKRMRKSCSEFISDLLDCELEIQTANAWVLKNDFDRALEIMNRCKEYPGAEDVNWQGRLSTIYIIANRYEEALEIIREKAAREPQNVTTQIDFCHWLLIVRQKEGLPEAHRILEYVKSVPIIEMLRPGQEFMYGLIALEEERFDEASRYIERAINLQTPYIKANPLADSYNNWMRGWLALAQGKAGNIAEATILFDSVREQLVKRRAKVLLDRWEAFVEFPKSFKPQSCDGEEVEQ